jgi:hypothetical protein
MATDWEETLKRWVKPPSDSEETKRDCTEDEIRTALSEYKPLPNAIMRIFAQGSYKNKTNVRLLSDVDIAVEYQRGESLPTTTPSIATTDKIGSAKELSNSDLGLTDGGESYNADSYKDHVEAAMIAAFGEDLVERGDKAIRIKPGPTTLPADVVPCFPHRRYDSRTIVHRGIRIFPDKGFAIENFPQQHYDNGVAKNTRTGRRFKRMVRAFKRMSHHLADSDSQQRVPSFTLESMVYNVPDSYFGTGTYLDDFKAVAFYMWYNTYNEERCDNWHEVNELKYLFRGGGKNQRVPASNFAWDAWKAVGGE